MKKGTVANTISSSLPPEPAPYLTRLEVENNIPLAYAAGYCFLRQDLLMNFAVDVGEAEVATLELESQTFMVDT